MKRLIILVSALLQVTLSFAQKAESLIHQGNKLYSEQNYKDAEAKYLKSVEKKEASVEGNFNLGDAFYKQKKFKEASEQFTSLAETARDESVKAKAYHNLGNTLLQSKKLEEGIAAYKKSLIANPKDDQTRYNLAYAQEMLKKQQDQQKNKDNKDQKKDQDKKNKEKGDPGKKDPDKSEQPEKNEQQKDEEKQKQEQQDKEQEQGQQPQPNKLSKEDAERLLEALNNNEQQTQDKLKNQKLKGVKRSIEKDW